MNKLPNPSAPAPHNPADWKVIAADVDPVLLGMDGGKWAEAFCQRNKASDFGSMVGWFANAICAGFDEGQRRATAAKIVPAPKSVAEDEQFLALLPADLSGTRRKEICDYVDSLRGLTCQACKGGGIQADGPCACQQQADPDSRDDEYLFFHPND